MAGRVIKRLLAGVLTVAVVIPGNFVPAQAAEEPQEDYLIYPNPHKVEYQEGDYILGKELNVIYDKGIDEATKNRLQEAADLKGIEVNEAEQPKEGATNVYMDRTERQKIILQKNISRKTLCLERRILTFWQVMRM